MPTINKIKRPWIKYYEAMQGMKDNKFYHSPAWRNCRLLGLKQEPLCREHKKKKELVPATIRDHIVPINPDNGWNYQGTEYPNPLDMSNHQSLCKSCHAKKMAIASNK